MSDFRGVRQRLGLRLRSPPAHAAIASREQGSHLENMAIDDTRKGRAGVVDRGDCEYPNLFCQL